MVGGPLAHELLLGYFHFEANLVVVSGCGVGLTFTSRLIDLLMGEVEYASFLIPLFGLLGSENYSHWRGVSSC